MIMNMDMDRVRDTNTDTYVDIFGIKIVDIVTIFC
jgi:hypothetical protein